METVPRRSHAAAVPRRSLHSLEKLIEWKHELGEEYGGVVGWCLHSLEKLIEWKLSRQSVVGDCVNGLHSLEKLIEWKLSVGLVYV